MKDHNKKKIENRKQKINIFEILFCKNQRCGKISLKNNMNLKLCLVGYVLMNDKYQAHHFTLFPVVSCLKKENFS